MAPPFEHRPRQDVGLHPPQRLHEPALAAMTDCGGPPSYQDAISHGVNTQLSGEEHFTLVLDGRTIYPAAPPSQFLYQISSPPGEALAATYAVHKWRFRLAGDDGALKSRLDHIYDVQELRTAHSLRPGVRIEGRASNRHTHREVVVLGGHTGWSTCAATEGWFRADVSLRERLVGGRRRVSWRSRHGVLVGEETAGAAREGVLPRLEVRAALDERELDLLVACWVARVWKEAQAEARAAAMWKRIAGRGCGGPARAAVKSRCGLMRRMLK